MCWIKCQAYFDNLGFSKTTFADTHLHYQNNIKNDKK